MSKMVAEQPELARVEMLPGSSAVAGSVKVDGAKIGKLTLSRVQVGHPSAEVLLRGVKVHLRVQPFLEWKIKLGTVERTGASRPAAMTALAFDQPVSLRLPADVHRVDLASITLENLAAGAAEARDVALGRIVVEAIKAASATTQDAADDPEATARITEAKIEGITGSGAPAVVVAGASIGRVSLDALPLPPLTVGGVSLPPIQGNMVRSEGVVIDGPVWERSFEDADGILQWRLGLEMSARLEIDQLELALDATVAVGEITLEGVSLPLAVESLSLGDLGLHDLSVRAVSLGPA